MKRVEADQLWVSGRRGERDSTIQVCAVVSLLHEEPDINSCTRLFRDQPVLAWTLSRIGLVDGVKTTVVLCWDDQTRAASDIAELAGATLVRKGPRLVTRNIRAIATARAWADGWRGGLLGSTAFDRGFHARFVREAAECVGCDHVLLVDAAAALVDPELLNQLVERVRPPVSVATTPERYAFNLAMPGTGGIILGPDALKELEKSHAHPGSLLSYHPDRPAREPTSTRACVPANRRVARSLASLLLDSQRQIDAIEHAAAGASLADMERLVDRVEQFKSFEPSPRDVVIELTTRRRCTPVWSILSKQSVDRCDMKPDTARQIAAELAGVGDVRVTFAGVGDPLLHPDFAEIMRAFRDAGVRHLHVETDLIELAQVNLDALIACEIDAVSVHIPAMTHASYQAVMGVDAIGQVLENVRRLVTAKAQVPASLPLLVPTFVKCKSNQGEMEEWVDQWLRASGSAVVRGASDLGGMIDDASPVTMAPPLRRACRRLSSSLHVLSDGSITTCDQDVLARQVVANVSSVGLLATWRTKLRGAFDQHEQGAWDQYASCRNCTQWDRPA